MCTLSPTAAAEWQEGSGSRKTSTTFQSRSASSALLPAVRNSRPTDLIVADGFSCREQISQLTSRHALHIAEVLQLALRQGRLDGDLPEAVMVRERAQALRSSKLRTLAALGAIAASGIALACAVRNNGAE